MEKEYSDEEIKKSSKILSEERESFAKLADELTPEQLRGVVESSIQISGIPVRKLLEEERKRNFNHFHRLWTKSLTSSEYDKRTWLEIERQMQAAGVI